MMHDIAKWSVLFSVMLVGFAGSIRILYSQPDAAHILGETPPFCYDAEADGAFSATVFWGESLFDAIFSLGTLHECLRASDERARPRPVRTVRSVCRPSAQRIARRMSIVGRLGCAPAGRGPHSTSFLSIATTPPVIPTEYGATRQW